MMATHSLPISTVRDADAAGVLVADRILERYVATGDGRFHLGCPAGRTPITTYAALGRLAADRGIDLGRLVIVMMDEYVVDGRHVDRTSHFSCRGFADRHIVRHVGDVEVLTPDVTAPAAYDAVPIDLFLLASGASDGHVAFNGPGTALATRTRVVELAESTRRDSLRTFPDFADIDEVPRHGVTVGLGTIVSAKEAVLVLLGAGKAKALRRLHVCAGFDPAWPASVIHECARRWVVVDEAAATGMPGLPS